MIFTSQGFKYFCVAMKIKSSLSFPLFTVTPPSSPYISSSFDSTLFPKPAADILLSGAHPMGLVKYKRDLNNTIETLRANKEVVYNY